MDKRYLWQVSVPPAVTCGFVAPVTTVAEALSHGDVGICSAAGTGDLACIVNGTCYELKPDARVVVAAPETKLTQVTVGDFDHYASVFLSGESSSVAEFRDVLEARPEVAKAKNSLQMVLGTGRIACAELSGPKPEAGKGDGGPRRKQVREVHDVTGVVVGVRRPNYLEVSGKTCWRMVFISEDNQHLGHLLGFSGASLACQITRYDGIQLTLPSAKAFSKVAIRA